MRPLTVLIRTHDTSPALFRFKFRVREGRKAYTVVTKQWSLYWALYRVRDLHPRAWNIKQVQA